MNLKQKAPDLVLAPFLFVLLRLFYFDSLFSFFKHSFKNASNFKTFSSSSSKSLGLTSNDFGHGGIVPDFVCTCLLSATNSFRGVRYCIVLISTFLFCIYCVGVCVCCTWSVWCIHSVSLTGDVPVNQGRTDNKTRILIIHFIIIPLDTVA